MHWKVATSEKELQSLRRQAQQTRMLTKPFFFAFKPWIAGINHSDAVAAIKKLNHRHCKGLANFLGEHYKDPEMVLHAMHEYRQLIRALSHEKEKNPLFNAAISLKPSQFGFDLECKTKKESRQIAFENLSKMVDLCAQQKVPVEIDMESAAYTDFTIGFYRQMLEKWGHSFPYLRLCLQANLKRTEQDLHDLADFGRTVHCQPSIRLVKGVYREAKNPTAFHEEPETLENFFSLVETAFESGKRLDIAIGTHRADILDFAEQQSKKYAKPFELQLLRGMGEKIKQRRLHAKKPYTEYVPYGKDAVAYGLRRWKKMLGGMAKNMLGQES